MKLTDRLFTPNISRLEKKADVNRLIDIVKRDAFGDIVRAKAADALGRINDLSCLQPLILLMEKYYLPFGLDTAVTFAIVNTVKAHPACLQEIIHSILHNCSHFIASRLLYHLSAAAVPYIIPLLDNSDLWYKSAYVLIHMEPPINLNCVGSLVDLMVKSDSQQQKSLIADLLTEYEQHLLGLRRRDIIKKYEYDDIRAQYNRIVMRVINDLEIVRIGKSAKERQRLLTKEADICKQALDLLREFNQYFASSPSDYGRFHGWKPKDHMNEFIEIIENLMIIATPQSIAVLDAIHANACYAEIAVATTVALTKIRKGIDLEISYG
jgi:hypothetical protein